MVVLINLLIGLAVSDIGHIRDEAEVLSLKSQVDLISYWESILLNDPYNFLTSWPKLLTALPSFSFVFGYQGVRVFWARLQEKQGFYSSTSVCPSSQPHSFQTREFKAVIHIRRGSRLIPAQPRSIFLVWKWERIFLRMRKRWYLTNKLRKIMWN